jgi:hypothetical protein
VVEWLENPRKAPRARLCLPATVVAGAATFEARTEDLGPHGCQLVAAQPLPSGAALGLAIHAPEAPSPLQVRATVAWAGRQPPWRLGVAFEASSQPAAAAFFDTVVAARPGVADRSAVPDRISSDAMVWLAPPPRLVVDFTPDEVAVLRAVGSGASVFELRARLRDRWAGGQHAFFSLLTSHHVTLNRGGAVPFANWSTLLRQLEAELAVGALGESPEPAAPSPPPPAPGRAPAQAPPSSGRFAPSRQGTPAATGARSDGAAGLAAHPDSLELDQAPRSASGPRRAPEAAEAFRQALDELAAGRQVSALSLLRRALALAPGDLEIARKVGEVASGRG